MDVRFFLKLILPRFVIFCRTWLRTCELCPIFLISTEEKKNIEILYCTLSSASQGQQHGWVSIPTPPPPRHTLLPLSPLRQSTLSLTFSPISFPFSRFPPSPLYFLYLPDSHLPSLSTPVTLSPPSRGDYVFFEIQREKAAGGDHWVPRRHRKLAENPTLTSILSSFLTLSFRSFCSRRTSKRCVRGRVWSPGEHQRTSRNTRTSTQPQTVPGCVVGLKISWGKGMMGFFCCTHSHFLTGWMCHSYGSHLSGQDRFRGKTSAFIDLLSFPCLKFGFSFFFIWNVFLTQIVDVAGYTVCKAHWGNEIAILGYINMMYLIFLQLLT